MRKATTAILAAFIACTASAQVPNFFRQDTAVSRHIVVKGDDIRRFPATNLMEALNGHFPWLFSSSGFAHEFTFVVDGFLLQDINAISLNDIEDIVFSRDPLYASHYPFSRAGTFFINTRKSKSKRFTIDFTTQYNLIWNKDKIADPQGYRVNATSYTMTNTGNNKPGHLFMNHLGLSASGNRAAVYFSAQLNTVNFPEIHQHTDFAFGNGAVHDTIESIITTKRPDQRLFLRFTYKFSGKINAGITAGYSHNKATIDSAYTVSYAGMESFGKVDAASSLNYYHGGAFVTYMPFKRLSNTLWFEYGTDTVTATNNYLLDYTDYLGQAAWTTDDVLIRGETKRYLLRNELKYNFAQGRKFTGNFSLVFDYLRHDATGYRGRSMQQRYGGWATGFTWFDVDEKKITSLNPVFDFTWLKMVSGYAGINQFIGKKTFKNIDNKDKTGMYGGVTLNFAALKRLANRFNDLSLSFNYSDLTRDNSNNQRLGGASDPYTSLPSTLFAVKPVSNDPYVAGFYRSKSTSVQLSATSHNNRFRLLAEWNKFTSEKMYSALLSGPSQVITLYFPGKERQEALAFSFSGRLVENTVFRWRTGLNMLVPVSWVYGIGTMIENKADHSALMTGLQNRLEYRNFYVFMNQVLNINQPYVTYDIFVAQKHRHTSFAMNHFLIGYTPGIGNGSVFRQLSVFVQLRNLYASKRPDQLYGADKYAGIGINAIF